MEILSDYQRIVDFFDLEFLALDDVNVIFIVRASNTLKAFDVVLAQV